MAQALNAVVTGGMSVREAASRFGVPKSTLGDRVSGRVQSGAVSGPKTYLTADEETEFVKVFTLLRRNWIPEVKKTGASIGKEANAEKRHYCT